jgi:hypothetical protein
MVTAAIRFAFVLALVGASFSGCAQVKETGRTIGHTTRDVTTEIGHGARDVTREIGHGTRDAVRDIGEGTRDATKAGTEQVKKVVRPERDGSEY